MAAKRFWILGLIPVALAGVAIAGVRSYCTRPSCLRGIPARDYQYGSPSRPETALSKTFLVLTTTANNRTTKKIKYYQLDRTKLTIEHCSVSKVVLQIHDNGVWVMSLKADQNPRSDDQQPQPVTPSGRFTAHLKRNLFVVKVRCYGAYQQEPQPGDAVPGRPVLFELEPVQFWVQRGRPRRVWKQGYIECPKELLELVDRVELEFFYR